MNDREAIEVDAQRLLDAYRVGTSPSTTETSKLWARVAVPVAAPVMATSAVLKVVVGAAMVVGSGAAAIAIGNRAPEPPRAEVIERSAVPTASREAAPTVEPAMLPEPIAAPSVVTLNSRMEPARPSTPARVQPSAPASATPGLAEEITLLERARVAVGRGETKSALSILAEHERVFPSGALVEERRAMRIIALCGTDELAKGRAEARSFLAGHPAAALASRIRDACELGAVTETTAGALTGGEP